MNMPGELPFVSLIIPVYNAASTLRECLEGVARLEYPADRIEVIVVDNNSTDDSARIAAECGFPPRRCEKQGASAARNCGIAAAHGEILAFIDSDAVPDADWLRLLVAPFVNPQVGGVGGTILYKQVKTGPECHAYVCLLLNQRRLIEGDPPYMLPFAATANAAFRAELVRRVGGFDESLFVCEDADLCWRVQWDSACRLEYVEKAYVRHYFRSEIGPYLRQIHSYGKASADLFAKHRRRLGRRAWIEWKNTGMIFWALIRAPFMAIFARSGWERRRPLYDLAAAAAWKWGRLKGAFRHRLAIF